MSIKSSQRVLFTAAVLVVLLAAATAHSQTDSSPAFPELRWRLIGPFRGGRSVTATGVPGNPNEYLFGGVAGGVWRTTNGGNTWQPIFDAQSIASIGAIAVAPSDPRTIYVGSGEADMRSDISYGDGVYKSVDGGATWRNVGLRETQQIGSIWVDPGNPDVLLVAALGHAYGPNPERGVYRSTDGGGTWSKVLFLNDNTGAIALAADPSHPGILYASLWQARRFPGSAYAPVSGPGSGLYKSTDGGVHWAQILGHGFPAENLGRIGIAVAPSEQGRRVYAIVDARDGGLYRSDDSGETWRRVSADSRIWQRGWYFGSLTVDPKNPNTVYVMNTSMYRSSDGGQNFQAFKGAPGGDDYHSLWIAPDDSSRMVLASDQGTVISVDGGLSWSSWFNQPTAQFYHVLTDDRFPYWVYGSQQDSGTAGITSRSDYGQITFRDWSPVGGEESGYIAISPAEPLTVYGGGPYGVVTRFDWTTGQSLNISPGPRAENGQANRGTWTSPLVFSPQDPHRLYFGTQFLLVTSDRGSSWETLSPDLTLANPVAKNSERDNRGVIYSIAPSPAREHQIWVGTDNGLIQLTTNEGQHWSNVTPPGVPEWSKVNLIEAPHSDAGTAYAAINRHESDDYRPYIYRTHDFGKTWTNVVDGLPSGTYVNAVREDSHCKGLLFAGTELGVYFSIDDGDRWRPLQLNLPVTSIRDLAIHGDDLIVATHGRAFWILDDIEPLRETACGGLASGNDLHLYRPAKAVRIRRSENQDTPLPPETPVGSNPPAGALIDYRLPPEFKGEVILEIRDPQGNLIRRYSSGDAAPALDTVAEFPAFWLPHFSPLSAAPGAHRFVWDLRYTPPPSDHPEYSMTAIIGKGTVTDPQGPLVLPGTYEVRLIAGQQTLEEKIEVAMDPRVHVAAQDLAKQLDLASRIGAEINKGSVLNDEVSNIRSQIRAITVVAAKNQANQAIILKLNELDRAADMIQGGENAYPAPSTGLGQIVRSLSALATAVGTADSAPTRQAEKLFTLSEAELNKAVSQWEDLKSKDIQALNQELSRAKLAEIHTSGAIQKN